MNRLFKFKTIQPTFDKERSGIKNNTFREIDLNDDRFLDLIAWSRIGWNDGDIIIQIREPDMPSLTFEREIRDITIYRNVMIITWKAAKDKEKP